MEEITLKSNSELEARLTIPSGAEKAIVIAHSFRNDFNTPICKDAETNFSNLGYATLAFSFLGHGASGGKMRDVGYTTVSENVSDSIRFLRNEGFEKVGVYAISLGTVASVLAEERPGAQILLSPSPLYDPRGLFDRYSAGVESQRDKLAKDGFAIIPSGSGRGNFEMGAQWIQEMEHNGSLVHARYKENNTPTLIIQGSCDDLSPVEKRDGFVSKFGGEYFLIEGADHNFSAAGHRNLAIKKASEWFENKI